MDVFTRAAYRDIVLESLGYCRQAKGLRVFAYVLMSNHLHMIARAEEGQQLSAILRDFKKFTSRKILDLIENGNESRKEWMLHVFSYYARQNTNNRHYQVWIQDNHPYAPESTTSNLRSGHENRTLSTTFYYFWAKNTCPSNTCVYTSAAF